LLRTRAEAAPPYYWRDCKQIERSCASRRRIRRDDRTGPLARYDLVIALNRDLAMERRSSAKRLPPVAMPNK
jgi:hypothetical protein